MSTVYKTQIKESHCAGFQISLFCFLSDCIRLYLDFFIGYLGRIIISKLVPADFIDGQVLTFSHKIAM